MNFLKDASTQNVTQERTPDPTVLNLGFVCFRRNYFLFKYSYLFIFKVIKYYNKKHLLILNLKI